MQIKTTHQGWRRAFAPLLHSLGCLAGREAGAIQSLAVCGAATTTTSKGVGGVTQYVDEGRVEGGWMLTCGDASVADGRRTSMDRSARDW